MTVDFRQLETGEARLMEFFRHMVAIGIAATVTGLLVGGLGSRLFMLVARLLAPERIGAITENGNRVGDVTFGGTAALLIFVGLATAMAIGVLAASAETWLAWTGRMEGLVLGVAASTAAWIVGWSPGTASVLPDQPATAARSSDSGCS